MSKKRSKGQQSRGNRAGAASDQEKPKDAKPRPAEKRGRGLWPSPAAWREIIESVVIAFVLAFLFRTFEAEAFVIPTGSMAPTLLGRHKDAVCPECGYPFQVSASDEVETKTGDRKNDDVVSCTCPMCGRAIDLGPGNPEAETYASYKGDRILVVKFPYQFADPKRWDVAVFKYPGEAKVNFIKRVVGLPRETIVISHGDLFVKPAEQEDFKRFASPPYKDATIDLDRFTIARKPPRKIRAMLQPVYDNDRVLPKLIEGGWPARWSPWPDHGFRTSDDYRSFYTDGSAPGEVWIQYRHVVPSYEDWGYLIDGVMPPHNPRPKPQLITDFSGYNTEVLRSTYSAYGQRQGGSDYEYEDGADEDGPAPPTPDKLGLHWVGDLAVECDLDVQSQSGEVLFELVEGGRGFHCRIDVSTGKATLSIDGLDSFRPTAQSGVRGPDSYRIMFSNIDDQLLLWVDGDVVRFDTATAYDRLDNVRPSQEDLWPVRIGSRGAALRVGRLKIYRDLYYIAQRGSPPYPYNYKYRQITDFLAPPYSFLTVDRGGRFARAERAQVLSDPKAWDAFASTRRVAFPLKADQFLMLGDNSAESKDSRLWEGEPGRFAYYVRRELLIGKALFIYWPHSQDRIPYTKIPFPFFPNFRRMWFVR